MIQGHFSTRHGYSDMTFCSLFIATSYPHLGRLHFRPIAHSASMHSSLVTTNILHCVLTARCQRSIQLDNQPAMPLRTRQQDYSPAHHPTVISSTMVLLAHSFSRPWHSRRPVTFLPRRSPAPRGGVGPSGKERERPKGSQ